MKAVIQKIILSYFGTFIKGIESDKLSVNLFGGNFQLQNISLNHQFFDSLNTPFKLSYSSIGKLNLQAPLSKLATTPVECVLDNIYAVFQFKDDEQNQSNKEDKIFLERRESFEKYVKEMFETYLKKLREKQEKKKEDGVMAKLGKKIIDNLQLKIVNVHIRFEEKDTINNYSWGLTLDEISFVTTDKDWKPAFIDRSGQVNKNEKLLKKMNLKRLNIYWRSMKKGDMFITDLETNSQKEKVMSQMIKGEENSILSLTSEAKLIINPQNDLDLPLYELSIDLAPIIFDLERRQVLEMIDFAKKIIFQNEEILKNLTLKKKKSSKQIQSTERKKYEEFFNEYMEFILMAKTNNLQADYEFLESQDNKTKLKILFNNIQSEELMLWALRPIKNKVKVEREKQLKKQKKGWFGGEYSLTQEEIMNLEKFVEESVQMKEDVRPPTCLFFSLKTVIHGGIFSFIDHKGTKEEQKIQFKIGKIEAALAKSNSDAILKTEVEIGEIGFNLYLPHYDKKDKVKMNILMTEGQENGGESGKKFLNFKYVKTIQMQEKPIVTTTLEGELQRVILTYKKIYMKKFKSFFTFENINDSIRTQTAKRWDYMKGINEEQEDQMMVSEEKEVEKLFNINVNVISPAVICPLGEEEDCWCLNLGQLAIKSKRTEEEEIYPMKITSAFFRYYLSVDDCMRDLDREIHESSGKFFSVVNDIDFTLIHTYYLKNKVTKTEVMLPNFEVKFTENQYKNLLTLRSIFKVEESQKNFLDTLKKNRKQVESKMVYQGQIQKKNDNLDTWKTYFGILSSEFIHLYGGEKEVKCLQKISIKHTRLQFNEQTNLISLISQQGVVELKGAEEEKNTQIWKKKIENKMKEYMTLYQIVENLEHVKNEKKQNKRNRKMTGLSSSSDLHKKQKILQIQVNKIGFSYKDNNQKDLMNFQITKLMYKQIAKKEEKSREVEFQQLSAIDYIYKYKDKDRQSLIYTKNVFFHMNKDKNKKIQVDLEIPEIKINWKPDVLVILFQLLKKHFSKEKVLRVDDDQEKTRTQLFEEVLSDKKYAFSLNQYERNSQNRKVKEKRESYSKKNQWMRELVKINIRIKNTQMNMIHRQTHLTMFKAIAGEIETQLVIGENEKFVAGSIHEIDLYEMTGYPLKQYRQMNDVKEYKIIERKVGSSKPVIVFNWSSYNPHTLPNSEKVDSFLRILVNPINCNYIQQITFRLIDYILIQVILLLNQPQMLIANENLLQQLRRKSIGEKLQIEEPVKILFSEYEEIIKRIVNPYFMDLYFKLVEPSIVIKAEKSSEDYYRADLEQIVFKNRQLKSYKRFDKCECPDVKKYIYEEEYLISMEKCNFYMINKEKSQKLFQQVGLSLVVNKLILEDEINVIYPQINTYDRSFRTTNKMQKLIIKKCTRQQYLNLNKLVNFNFVFDDNKDQLFIHNFKITKLLSPKPIFYELIIPGIYMIAKEGTEEENWDLFEVNINSFKLTYERDADLMSRFHIWLGNTTVSGFEYLRGENEGKIERYELARIQGEKKSQYCADILIKMKTTGEKIIETNIQNIDASLKIHLLMLIFQWSLLEDWVFPNVSIYANDITFYATIHTMSAWLQQSNDPMSDNLPRGFRFLGFFCYKFHRKANYSIQHLQQKLMKGEKTTTAIDQMPETSYMTILLNTEVYHCLASEYEKIRRQVVEKLTLNVVQKRYFKVANEELSIIKTVANRKLNLDKGLLKISFTDIELMNSIFSLISKENQYIQYLRQKTKKVLPKSFQKQTQISSLQKIDMDAQSLSIYLINNSRSTFIPILRFNLSGLSLSKCNTSKKDLIKGTFDVGISYFNASIFRWEPVLEKTQLAFHKLNYINQELLVSNIFSSVEAIKPIMLNVSKEMLIAVKEIMGAWNRSKKKNTENVMVKKEEMKEIQKNIESVQFVSQYVIRNEIGYTIEIFNSKKEIKYQIKTGTERDYEYELQSYDEEEQIEKLIGINIMHPRYKFQRITHIPLDLNKEFYILPLIVDRSHDQTKKILPLNSHIVFYPVTKDSKRHLILKTTKRIEDYVNHQLNLTLLPFDHAERITLPEKPHKGIQVSLFEKKKSKDEMYRYVGNQGTLKILTKHLVYNYTPIPLQICRLFVFPGDFASISEDLTIQNIKYKDCEVIKVQHDEKKREYYITCGGYLVDYYGLYFQFGYDSKLFSHESVHNGFKYTIYLLSDSQSKFKVRLKKNYKSNSTQQCSALLKPIVGSQMFSLENPDGSLCEFTIYGYLSRFNFCPNSDFKKIIQISPSFILSNATKFKIKICQIESFQSMTLSSFERVPFFWENKNKPKCIKIAVFDGQEMWGYSGPLKIDQSTQSFVLRKSSNGSQYKLMSIQIQNTNTINLVHIIENQTRDSSNIILSNQVPGLVLRFYQTNIFEMDSQLINPYECFFRVKYGEQIPFGYELPLQKHEITMQIDFIPDSKSEYMNANASPVILSEIENNLFDKHISIYKNQKRIKKLLLRLGFEGNMKKLKLLVNDDMESEENKGQLICKVPKIGISLVGYKQKIRKEIVHLIMEGVQLQQTTTDQTLHYGLIVKSFRIENQIKSRAIFPILLEPTKQDQFFLNFLLVKDTKNSKLIHYIGLSINNFNLSLTSEEIQYLQENTNEMMGIWNAENQTEETKIVRDYELFKKGKPIIEGNLYFVQAEIHPLKSIVTFKHVNNWGGRILKTFSSLDDCKISVDGKKITHFSCKNISEFLRHVMKHYQDGVYKMIIPVLGNLSILGSPVSLAQRIGSGFKDLIELPSEGFTRSPLEGGKGLAKGAGSLMKNTFEGAFNSVQSISGSVGNGLSSLAFDDDFSKQRQKIKNEKSQHLGDGLLSGAKSIANGVGRGITGLVTSPVEGAQENGIGGFFLGGLKGITGLVVKPVSGLLDATTKTFEGIKNTPGYIKQVGNKKEKVRARHPRVLYNYCRQFRSYDPELALCAKILIDHDEEKYENLSWFDIYFLISEKEDKKPIIFLTYEYFIIYNLKSDKIMQSYRTEDIHDAEAPTKQRLRIKIFDRKKKQFGQIEFMLKNQLARRLEAELKTVCKYYRPVYGFDYKINKGQK